MYRYYLYTYRLPLGLISVQGRTIAPSREYLKNKYRKLFAMKYKLTIKLIEKNVIINNISFGNVHLYLSIPFSFLILR